MTEYERTVAFAASRVGVYDAIGSLDGLRGWWTPLVDGTPKTGGELRFRFEGRDEQIRIRVDEAIRPSLVRWYCLEHSGASEWDGTKLTFELTEVRPDTCELRFRHSGLRAGTVEVGWDRFLASLVNYVEQGEGTPFRASRRGAAATPAESLEVVRAYHRAWTSKAFEQAGRHLSPNLETDVPINTYNGKEEFLAALTGFGELVTGVDLLAEFAGAHEALLLYDLAVEPIGTLRVAEHFTVSGGRITRIRHVHDTAALRAAGFAP